MRGALCAALWLLAALRPLPAALPAPAPAVAAVGAYGAVATPAVPTVGKGHAAAAPTAPAAGPGCAAALLDDDPAQQELPLEEYMQDDWRDFFAEQPFSLGELRGKSFGEICAAVWAHVGQALRAPLRVALRVCALLLAVGLFGLLGGADTAAELRLTLQSVMTAALFLLVCRPVLELVGDCAAALDKSRLFLAQFVPVLCSILAAGGQAGTAAVYGTVFFGVISAVAQLLYAFISPLVRCFLALSATRGMCGSLRLEGVVSLARRVVYWVMGLAAMLFSAYLGFQSVLANAGDSLAMRAGRFLVAGGVPIVGGALSEALGTVYTGLRLVKSAAGTLGVVGLVLLFGPVLVRCFAYNALCLVCAAVADLAGNAPARGMLEGMAESVRMMGAILAVYLALLVLAVALAVLLGVPA